MSSHSMSVCLISGSSVGTTFEYRVLHKQEQLALCGIRSLVRHYLPRRDVTLEEALSCTVVYLYRVPHDAFIEDLIERALARGIPTLFDTDDLIFEPELAQWVDSLKTMSDDEAALYYEGVWRYRQTLLACDYVVAATEYLAERARAHGKLTFVHRNALGERFMQIAEGLYRERQMSAAASGRIIIGYVSGTATHNRDFLEASPALVQVLQRHPEVELHVLGPLAVPAELNCFGERVRSLTPVHWTEVPHILNTFDINLGPLERENPFCRGKSEVKYIEAASLGIPTVASRIDAFEFAIRDGENGFLAGDPAEWIEKLEQLLADPALRQRMGQAARADALTRYAAATRSRELAETLQAIQRLHPQPQISSETEAEHAARRPLVLNWIFTEPIPGSGGHADIIRMMNLLASFGHQVNVYTVPFTRLSDKSDLEIRRFVERHFTELRGHLQKWIGGPVAEADATILTYWETAYMLGDRIDASKIFYFVQDWEPFFYSMGTQYLRAEQTYKMGFSCITLGRWLTEYLRRQYGADADYFDLAVDHDIYYPRSVNRPDQPRICFYARPSTPRRLFPLGIAALQLVYQRHTNVEIVFYGAADTDLAGQAIPFPFVNRGLLSEEDLATLFSTSHVGLVLSASNCSLVTPEMMACKCAVIDLNRETVQGVLEHEVNALLAEPTPEAIAGAILRLLDDASLRQRLVESAYRQVQDLSWEKSARRVESLLYEKLSASGHRLIWPSTATRSSLPSTSDLPADQQERLNALHRRRGQAAAQWRVRARGWLKRWLGIERGMLLNRKAVQTIGEIAGRRYVGQSFVARHARLHRIDLLVATYGRRNTRDVIFHLKTSPAAAQDLATVRVNTSLMADNNYVHFVFEPRPDSSGKAYYFYLESPESAPGDAITLWTFSQVNLPNAELSVNGRRQEGQLIFGVFYTDEALGEVGERPLLHEWRRPTTLGDRVVKAYQVLTTQGLSGFRREVGNYRKWRTGKRS
ncbi:MAG TPA: glycosyltransferase [Anaerolineae bacterium]|nr:glycosyltransferase [Anaerolineae bacterium]